MCQLMALRIELEQYIDGLVQDCSNSSASAVEFLQSCTKSLIWSLVLQYIPWNMHLVCCTLLCFGDTVFMIFNVSVIIYQLIFLNTLVEMIQMYVNECVW